MPEPGPYRVLVTGSRNWADSERIARELAATAENMAGRRSVVLVHGACPTGADAIAAREALALGWETEPHPADWTAWGRAAGVRRNAEMVALGADACLAFLTICTSRHCSLPRPHDSHGASDCTERAEKAGIPVQRFRPGDAP
jgi:hypothetical protein